MALTQRERGRVRPGSLKPLFTGVGKGAEDHHARHDQDA
jgi:hypothetical protein